MSEELPVAFSRDDVPRDTVNIHAFLPGSERILRRMSGVLEETANPGNLVSARGIAKLFLPIR